MLVARYNKQPAEIKRYIVQMVDFLGTGEVISSVASSVLVLNPLVLDSPSEPLLTTSSIAIVDNGNTFQYLISAGTNGKRYKVTFLVNTSAGQIVELEAEFRVQEL